MDNNELTWNENDMGYAPDFNDLFPSVEPTDEYITIRVNANDEFKILKSVYNQNLSEGKNRYVIADGVLNMVTKEVYETLTKKPSRRDRRLLKRKKK